MQTNKQSFISDHASNMLILSFLATQIELSTKISWIKLLELFKKCILLKFRVLFYKILYFIEIWYYRFLYVLSFVSFLQEKKSKESTKENKEKMHCFLRLHFVQPFFYVRLCRISYTRYCATHTLVAWIAEHCLRARAKYLKNSKL